MIEKEKKLLLSKEEYYCLLEHFGKGKPITEQTNYYFDTDELSMNERNITCRVRFKDGRYTATVKKHTIAEESSYETDIEVRNGIHDNVFIDFGLQMQGELVTERCVLIESDHYIVLLDRNEYQNRVDYELEIEYSSNFEQEAAAILHTLSDILLYHNSVFSLHSLIERCKNTKSKSQRFFEAQGKTDPDDYLKAWFPGNHSTNH